MDKKDWSYLCCSYLSGLASLAISAGITLVVLLVDQRIIPCRPIGWVLLFGWCAVGFALALNCRARMFFWAGLGISLLSTLMLLVVLAARA